MFFEGRGAVVVFSGLLSFGSVEVGILGAISSDKLSGCQVKIVGYRLAAFEVNRNP